MRYNVLCDKGPAERCTVREAETRLLVRTDEFEGAATRTLDCPNRLPHIAHTTKGGNVSTSDAESGKVRTQQETFFGEFATGFE